MRMMSELASGAATRSVLYAKGATERQAMAYLQPIVIDMHAVGNPWLNYSVYLSNILIPGVLGIFVFMITVYSLGSEIKFGTADQLHGGLLRMWAVMALFIVGCQGLGVFMFAMLPTLRLALSFASLWGVISFSISGMSFPCMAMHPALQGLSLLFPLRHYYLLYVNTALNGYPLSNAWPYVLCLLAMALLPWPCMPRLKKALASYRYEP